MCFALLRRVFSSGVLAENSYTKSEGLESDHLFCDFCIKVTGAVNLERGGMQLYKNTHGYKHIRNMESSLVFTFPVG